MKIDIGSIIKTHGYEGGVVLNIESNFNIELIEDCINKKGLVFIDIDGIPVPFFITEKVKVLNNKSILLYLENIEDEIKAKKIVNYRIMLEESCNELSNENEFSFEQLIKYSVFDVNLGLIGKIIDFMDIPSNPLFVVKKENEEILIPINKNFIIEIDDKLKELKIELPEGLVDINS
ncbi:MAG: 16S rRNA processing protein RimM [Bacteroidales bacterium]|nr:16S rRNA processing protein RimM [Bacteroidales bacterium]MBN2758241.1 16S rRNA processing protein RimM [Bacteroidales bacterium]